MNGRCNSDGNDRSDGGLFDPPIRDFEVGDEVVVQTMWGDLPAKVRSIEKRAGDFPVAMVEIDVLGYALELGYGDLCSIQLARIRSSR